MLESRLYDQSLSTELVWCLQLELYGADLVNFWCWWWCRVGSLPNVCRFDVVCLHGDLLAVPILLNVFSVWAVTWGLCEVGPKHSVQHPAIVGCVLSLGHPCG